MPKFQHVCSVDEIAPGQSRMFMIDQKAIGLFNIAGEFFALDNSCPHAGASLAHGYLEDDIVSCRIHHWRFCVRDGRYVDQDQPAFNAHTYDVRVVDGNIEVSLTD